MSKKFQKELCVYCAAAPSTSPDHVFAREFFLLDDRSGLPQVPACTRCNGEKSKLEHYLTSVLPFGARHKDAAVNLGTMVPKRLAANARLRGQLADNLGSTTAEGRSLTIPIDGRRLEELVALMVKGLIWHHWRVYMTGGHSVRSMGLASGGELLFANLFALNARGRVSQIVGRHVFAYEGIQSFDCPQISVWRLAIYGGLNLCGDPSAPAEICRYFGALTGPKAFLDRFLESATTE